MNKFWVGPRGIGGRTFPLHVVGKALIRGLQKGWNEKVENGGFVFYSGVSKDDVVAVSDEVKV